MKAKSYSSSENKTKLLWQKAYSQIKPLFQNPITKSTTLSWLVNSLRLDTEYLSEIYLGKKIEEEIIDEDIPDYEGNREKIFHPHKMLEPHELEQLKLLYDSKNKILKNANGQIATTNGLRVKTYDNAQAFILDIKGDLYMGTHCAYYSTTRPNINHNSYSRGLPLNMSGIIKINQFGKICYINDSSGHYAPEAIDIYRSIKFLQEKMPDIFAQDAVISIVESDSLKRDFSLADFINDMESCNAMGQKKFELLSIKRQEDIESYYKLLKNPGIVINMDKFNVSSPEEQAAIINKAMKASNINLTYINSCNQKENVSINMFFENFIFAYKDKFFPLMTQLFNNSFLTRSDIDITTILNQVTFYYPDNQSLIKQVLDTAILRDNELKYSDICDNLDNLLGFEHLEIIKMICKKLPKLGNYIYSNPRLAELREELEELVSEDLIEKLDPEINKNPQEVASFLLALDKNGIKKPSPTARNWQKFILEDIQENPPKRTR